MPRKKKKWNTKTKIVQALRRVWFYSPGRSAVVKRCKEGKKYRCEGCKELVDKIQVDHITPIVSVKEGFIDWNTFIDRLALEDETKQQGLCKICHAVKTSTEQEIRKKYKK